SVISTYHHFYILKDKGTEKELQNFLERSISSGTGALFEALKRLGINTEDIALESTVSCPREMSHYNGHHLTWPETPIGQSTLPDEMCVTAEGSALERKCLGDFYTGAHWSPVEKDCAGVQPELTVSLHRLSKTNITEDNVANTTMSMEMLTATSGDLSPTDVKYVAQILSNVASVPSIEPELIEKVVKACYDCGLAALRFVLVEFDKSGMAWQLLALLQIMISKNVLLISLFEYNDKPLCNVRVNGCTDAVWPLSPPLMCEIFTATTRETADALTSPRATSILPVPTQTTDEALERQAVGMQLKCGKLSLPPVRSSSKQNNVLRQGQKWMKEEADDKEY
ncbi:hypothetical protein AVEN_185679-1, partial [Araneus ventricosus]